MKSFLLSALTLTVLLGAGSATHAEKLFLLGVDGCDPNLLQQYMDEGLLPSFKRLADAGSFVPLETSMPPQSPVAWSSVITGMDPGGHGIFDFIHRDASTYLPFLSTSENLPDEKTVELFGYTLTVPGYTKPGGTVNLVQGTPFWEHLAAAGVPATIFKMPANYPPKEAGATQAVSDMGTPDMLGTYGTFSYYTAGATVKDPDDISGGNVYKVRVRNQKVEASIHGPGDPFKRDVHSIEAPFTVRLDPTNPVASITVGDERVLIREGEWSEWVPVVFEFSLLGQSGQGIVRFFLQDASRENFRLYVSPINFDPCADVGATTAPAAYAEDLCENIGRFYTQGMPEETKGLEGLIFSDAEFLQQRKIVFDERKIQMQYVLDEFLASDEGMTFFYFGSVDQTSHMLWRTMDEGHPAHTDEDGPVAAAIKETYQMVDPALGEILDAIDDDTTLMLISDHGFAPWYRSFHLNTWLKENGFLEVTNPSKYGEGEFLTEVNFWKTKAYAIGINSLYINERGREAKGTVNAGKSKDELIADLVEKLEAAVDPVTGEKPIKKVYRREEIYHGEYTENAPDLVIGYARGYRGSDESAKGQVVNGAFVEDNKKKWSGDHCVAHDLVPGVLLSNRSVTKTDPALVDVAPTVLSVFGIDVPEAMTGKPVF